MTDYVAGIGGLHMSMVCCQCQGEMSPDYGLQLWDGLDQQAWTGVCHSCWHKAWIGDRYPTFFIKSAFGKRIGMISKLLNPGMSWCHQCRTTWQYVPNHAVRIGNTGHSIFCFCEACWKEVNLTIKLDAYREWWDKHGGGEITWIDMFEAVTRDHANTKG